MSESVSSDGGSVSTGVAESVGQEVTTGEIRGSSQEVEAQEGTPEGGTESAEQKRYKFEKLKIRGEEQDFDLDHEQVGRLIQQAKGANDRYAEAKQLREEADTKFAKYEAWEKNQATSNEALKTNPIEAAMAAGANPAVIRQMAEQYLLGEIQKDEMSPEARENITLKQQIESDNKAKEEQANQTRQQQLQQAAEQQRKLIVPEIIKNMESIGLAKTAANVKRVAQLQSIGLKRGLPMGLDKAVQLVHEENTSMVHSTVGGQAKAINEAFKTSNNDEVLKIGKEIENYLGSDVLAALQRYGIVKYRTKSPNMPTNTIDTAKGQTEVEQVTTLSEDDVRDARAERVAKLQRDWNNRSAVPTP